MSISYTGSYVLYFGAGKGKEKASESDSSGESDTNKKSSNAEMLKDQTTKRANDNLRRHNITQATKIVTDTALEGDKWVSLGDNAKSASGSPQYQALQRLSAQSIEHGKKIDEYKARMEAIRQKMAEAVKKK